MADERILELERRFDRFGSAALQVIDTLAHLPDSSYKPIEGKIGAFIHSLEVAARSLGEDSFDDSALRLRESATKLLELIYYAGQHSDPRTTMQVAYEHRDSSHTYRTDDENPNLLDRLFVPPPTEVIEGYSTAVDEMAGALLHAEILIQNTNVPFFSPHLLRQGHLIQASNIHEHRNRLGEAYLDQKPNAP